VPALLAEHLGWPVITDVTQVDLRQHTVQVQRRLDRGAREEAEAHLPAVLAIEPGVARLRHAALPGLIAAQRAIIPVRKPDDLRLTRDDLSYPASLVREVTPPRPRPRAIFTPDSVRPPHERITQIITAGVTRKSGTMLEGPPDQMASAIIEFLRERGFVSG
jgi:electron transfer flavoprotein alpha/beta subunit